MRDWIAVKLGIDIKYVREIKDDDGTTVGYVITKAIHLESAPERPKLRLVQGGRR